MESLHKNYKIEFIFEYETIKKNAKHEVSKRKEIKYTPAFNRVYH